MFDFKTEFELASLCEVLRTLSADLFYFILNIFMELYSILYYHCIIIKGLWGIIIGILYWCL